ncbi:MAG TPA: Ig-like domain-containing protein [Ruminiclostridium sp.]|nr:Ig-like domain-containing protein [Ruminiclostridium sp.]
MKKINKVLICLTILCIFSSAVSCSQNNTGPGTPTAASISAEESVKPSRQINYNAKSINDPKSWVDTTEPQDGQTEVDSGSNITVKFKCDMDESTLNGSNIIIGEGKHSRIITELYNFNYDKETKTLNISFKLPGNGVGTGNGINVFISHKVKNIQGNEMGIDVIFGYSTK